MVWSALLSTSRMQLLIHIDGLAKVLLIILILKSNVKKTFPYTIFLRWLSRRFPNGGVAYTFPNMKELIISESAQVKAFPAEMIDKFSSRQNYSENTSFWIMVSREIFCTSASGSRFKKVLEPLG